MAIAISGIISVTVIIVALVMSAAYITTRQEKKMPRRIATQKEQEEIERALERYECCTRIINWVEADQHPSHGGSFLVTEECGPFSGGINATSIRWFDSEKEEWLNTGGKVIAWAEIPEPYKEPSRMA
mgnify:CR=1 FL=1